MYKIIVCLVILTFLLSFGLVIAGNSGGTGDAPPPEDEDPFAPPDRTETILEDHKLMQYEDLYCKGWTCQPQTGYVCSLADEVLWIKPEVYEVGEQIARGMLKLAKDLMETILKTLLLAG